MASTTGIQQTTLSYHFPTTPRHTASQSLRRQKVEEKFRYTHSAKPPDSKTKAEKIAVQLRDMKVAVSRALSQPITYSVSAGERVSTDPMFSKAKLSSQPQHRLRLQVSSSVPWFPALLLPTFAFRRISLHAFAQPVRWGRSSDADKFCTVFFAVASQWYTLLGLLPPKG